jgi:micrococcal nuclease
VNKLNFTKIRPSKSFVTGILAAILLLLSAFINEEVISPDEVIDLFPTAQTAEVVTRVIDGDTIVMADESKVRLIGVDAPEMNSDFDCYAQKAKQRLEELVLNKKIGLEKDISQTDKYGRLLRHVWVDEMLTSLVLVEEGWAQVSTYPPDVKYQADFLDAQSRAREKGLGIWGECIE